MVTECKANDIYVLDRQPCEIRGGDARQLVVVISPRAANIRRNAANVVPLLPLPETITPTATLFPLEGRYPMLVPGLLWADVAAQQFVPLDQLADAQKPKPGSNARQTASLSRNDIARVRLGVVITIGGQDLLLRTELFSFRRYIREKLKLLAPERPKTAPASRSVDSAKRT